jgi:hypothetical protein
MADRPPAAFFYSGPQGEHPSSPEELRRILHADGYAGFNAVFDGGQVTEAACWAHVRRKFFDEHEAGSPLAKEALDRIGALYAIESRIRGRPPDERQRSRGEHAKPLLAGLKAWLDVTLPKLSGKSDLAKAMRYTMGRWEARPIHDGRTGSTTMPPSAQSAASPSAARTTSLPDRTRAANGPPPSTR